MAPRPYSDSWVQHMGRYADMIVERLGLGAKSFVVEVASNDGYLLQYFVAKGIPVLGIEPAANIAKVAVEKGVPTLVEFFGERLARRLAGEGKQADLIAWRKRPGASAGRQRLRQGLQDTAEVPRRADDRIPAPHAAYR